MIFLLFCQNKFLIKTIVLTKYTVILYRLTRILNCKILYNHISKLILFSYQWSPIKTISSLLPTKRGETDSLIPLIWIHRGNSRDIVPVFFQFSSSSISAKQQQQVDDNDNSSSSSIAPAKQGQQQGLLPVQ